MSDLYDDPGFDDPGLGGAPSGFVFYRTRAVGDTLSDTFDFVRLHFRELFVGLLVIVGPLVLVQVLVAASFQTAWLDTITQSGASDPDAVLGLYADFGLRVGLLWLTSLLSYTLMAAATFGYVQGALDGEAGALTPGVLWEATKPLILPLLGITALATLLFVGSGLLNVIPCLGTLAWIALLIYLLPVVWIWQPARVFGTDTVGGAFSRARALVKGQWGPTFGAMILLLLVVLLTGVLVGLPVYVVSFMAGLGTAGEIGPVLRALTFASTLLGGLVYFAYALLYVGAALHYFNLVERADAVGLAGRVDDLDDAGPPGAPPAW